MRESRTRANVRTTVVTVLTIFGAYIFYAVFMTIACKVEPDECLGAGAGTAAYSRSPATQ
jgi:hypothetical protein